MENKIAEIRDENSISQADLAKIVGITRPYLSGIEMGKRNPTGVVILKIAKALNKKVEEIFFE